MPVDETEINNKLERILTKIQKPGRYVGGELNQVVKPWDTVKTRVCLAFPDIYDLGQPNLGLAILYDQINQRGDCLAERSFVPWLDMELAMRNSKIPLYALESHKPVKDFDILAFTLPYETLFTNTLNFLDLAGIPIHSADRTIGDPLVIAGGHAAYNPEPMSTFIDAFAIGDGEALIEGILETHRDWKESREPRTTLLRMLSKLPGVYVPSLYTPEYTEDGQFVKLNPVDPDIPSKITKSIVAELPPPPTKFIVPSIDVVHNRVAIEIMRGCTRGCRFCHAGMINRPVRERSVEEIVCAIRESLKSTGYEDVALLSLSSSDYSHILELVERITAELTENHLTVSLPSLRIESFSIDLMNKLKGSRQGGFTLAPEAASDRMRNTINKPIETQLLLDTAHAIYSRGWTTIKLYFMIGHPNETLEDVQEIVNLCHLVIQQGRKVMGKRANLHAGVSTFVPKPHTPFQWVPCDTPEQIKAKQDILRNGLRGGGMKLTWTSPEDTMLESWLSRGDRKIGDVIYSAWKLGAKFDAWQDQFNYDLWLQAFKECGLDPAFYTHRMRSEDEAFPWDHISPGVTKRYLLKEYQNSQDQKITLDCRNNCYACGILPIFNELRRENPSKSWLCPEVAPRSVKTA